MKKIKNVDEGGRPFLYQEKNWVAQKLHYWVGIHGSGKIIGPFFYPIDENGKCVMDGPSHFRYV